MAKIKHQGMHRHRLKQNPLEKVFADEWEKINKDGGGQISAMSYLMSSTNDQVSVTAKEARVAATVIQWLGSPVGQDFLERVKERTKEKK